MLVVSDSADERRSGISGERCSGGSGEILNQSKRKYWQSSSSIQVSESLTTAEQSQPPTRTFIAVSLLLATKTNLPAYESLGSTFALGGVRIV